MAHIVEVPLVAPIPVGHRVSIVTMEHRALALFGPPPDEWHTSTAPIVCDEDTRVIYATISAGLSPESTYERILFKTADRRVSPTVPIVRGVVTSCVVLTDSGDSVYMKTVLHLDAGPKLS
jgi:hypothetical protein